MPRTVGPLARLPGWTSGRPWERGVVRAVYVLAAFFALLVLVTALAPAPLPVAPHAQSHEAYVRDVGSLGAQLDASAARVHEISAAQQAGALTHEAALTQLAHEQSLAQSRVARLQAMSPPKGSEGIHAEALQSQRDFADSLSLWQTCLVTGADLGCMEAAALLSDATHANANMLAQLRAR